MIDQWHAITVEHLESDDDPDYTLTHPDTCEFEDGEFLGQPRRWYDCPTAYEFTFNPPDTWPPTSGTYQVRSWGDYYDGSEGREWDGGLEWQAMQGDSQ